jgi:hypothetical protein
LFYKISSGYYIEEGFAGLMKILTPFKNVISLGDLPVGGSVDFYVKIRPNQAQA